MRVAGAVAATILVGALALVGCRATVVAPAAKQFPIPDPYSVNGPVVAADSGAWFPAAASTDFGTAQPSGALGHIDAHGGITMIPMPTLDSYPETMTVGADGTVWFALTQGKGLGHSAGGNRVLADAHGELGWRRPDGSFHHLMLTGVTESIRSLAADADGGVWFAAYAFPHSVYGHVDAAGNLHEYAIPALPVCPTCDQEPATGMYAAVIAVGPAGSVWLEGTPYCQILQLDPATGSVLRQFFDPDSRGYTPGCANAAPLPAGGVAFPMTNQIATINPAGVLMSTQLPAEARGLKLAIATSAGGDLWCVATGHPDAARPGVSPSTLYKFPRTGPVAVSHPFPPNPTAIVTAVPDRSTATQYDLNFGSISAAADGSLWLAGVISIWHLPELDV
jgi:streptogramin lyase